MLSFLARRILLGISTLVFISFISFVIIQLPEGDYIDAYIAALEGQGGYAYDSHGLARGGAGATGALRAGPAGIRPILEVGVERPSGRPGYIPRPEHTSYGGYRRAAASHYHSRGVHRAVHLGAGNTHRDILCGSAKLFWGLQFHFHRLHRACDTRLPTGVGAHVLRLPVLRPQHWWPLLAGIYSRRPGAWAGCGT